MLMKAAHISQYSHTGGAHHDHSVLSKKFKNKNSVHDNDGVSVIKILERQCPSIFTISGTMESTYPPQNVC